MPIIYISDRYIHTHTDESNSYDDVGDVCDDLAKRSFQFLLLVVIKGALQNKTHYVP